jgi:hypothetical protein
MQRPGWTIIGPAALLSALDPLIALRRREGPVLVIEGQPTNLHGLCRDGESHEQSVLALDDESGPDHRCNFHKPVLRLDEKRTAVIGWLRGTPALMAAYAEVAVRLDQRRPSEDAQPLILLAPRERRYSQLQDASASEARFSNALETFLWTAERIRRETLMTALGVGLGGVLYTGHGNAEGWLAYRGMRATDIALNISAPNQAMAVLFSLACHTGAAGETPSFAERIIGLGAAGAVLAPSREVTHASTCALAPALARALGRGPLPLVSILASTDLELAGYSLLGDPAIAPIAQTAALDRCRAVRAPAPDDLLTSSPRPAWA